MYYSLFLLFPLPPVRESLLEKPKLLKIINSTKKISFWCKTCISSRGVLCTPINKAIVYKSHSFEKVRKTPQMQGPHSPGNTWKPEKTWIKLLFYNKPGKWGLRSAHGTIKTWKIFSASQKYIFHNKILMKSINFYSGSTWVYSFFIGIS